MICACVDHDYACSDGLKMVHGIVANHRFCIRAVLRCDHEDSLKCLGYVPQVESVMCLRWGWKQIVRNPSVQLHSRFDDSRGEEAHVLDEVLLQEASKD